MARRSRPRADTAARRAAASGACPLAVGRARGRRACRSWHSSSVVGLWARGAVGTSRRQSCRARTSRCRLLPRSRRCTAGAKTARSRRAPWLRAGGRRRLPAPAPRRSCCPGSSGRRRCGGSGRMTSCDRSPQRAASRRARGSERYASSWISFPTGDATRPKQCWTWRHRCRAYLGRGEV